MTAPGTLRDRLRAATRAGHAALDGHPLLAPLGAGALDARAYGDALVALHGVFAPLERDLVGAAAALGDLEAARRVPHLEGDLAELGRAPLPFALEFPVDPALAPSIGVAYVVLGSALGGQAIAARLAKRAGAPLPARFFASADAAAAARFRAVMASAESLCPEAARDDAARTAAALFDAMVRHLDRAAGHLR